MISIAGGTQPRWRRDGKELFFLAPDRKLMVVEVKGGSTFEAGLPRPLFQTRAQVNRAGPNVFAYDVSADGQRFLVNTIVGEQASIPVTVVVNWTAGLRR